MNKVLLSIVAPLLYSISFYRATAQEDADLYGSFYPCRPTYVGIKTNLLTDALLIPSLGVDFYLDKGWVLSGYWHYTWLKHDPKNLYWRTYGGNLEVRKYLPWGRQRGDNPFKGHHVGIYAGMITYDFELGNWGALSEPWSFYQGISYGYTLPLSKRLNLDFTIGLGHFATKYKEYIPVDDIVNIYLWQKTKERSFWGPTKAEISLVYLIGRANINKSKRR